MLGVELPEPVMALLNRMGQAAVALGLLSVGAGLNVSGVDGSRWLVGVVTAIKVALVPACALWFGTLIGLQSDMLATVVLFAALPTASSAYILAIQMGGNGPLVAAAITVSTLSAMITLPAWLSLVR
jgi:predicted permease